MKEEEKAHFRSLTSFSQGPQTVNYTDKYTRNQHTQTDMSSLIPISWLLYKSRMIAGLVNRAMIVSSDERTLEKEVKHMKTVMASKGYHKQFVNKAIRNK